MRHISGRRSITMAFCVIVQGVPFFASWQPTTLLFHLVVVLLILIIIVVVVIVRLILGLC